MPNKQWIVVALVCVFSITLMGCQTTESPDGSTESAADQAAVESPGDAASETGGEAAETGADASSDRAGEGEATEESQSPLMVKSGTAQLPEQKPIVEKERPQPAQGIQRVVTLANAIDAVDFEVLQPNDLPETAELQIVQLVEAAEGQESATLPAVRLIYDIDGQGVIVLLQSPATGEPADGEAADIGGTSGWAQETDQLIILTWEDGPVRYELRGSGIDMETLQRAAGSLGPAGA